MSVGVKGHSRWRLMVGVCFLVGQPLTQWEKGSRAQMAADGGGVIFGGQPLTQWEKGSRAQMASDGGRVILGGQPLTKWEKDRGRSQRKKRGHFVTLT